MQATLYESYRPVRPSDGDVRIFAPMSYPVVREAQIVPIVHIEAFALAAWFPVCWQIKDDQSMLVALRTLWRNGSHQPHGSPAHSASLPLALKAYPFVVGALNDAEQEGGYLAEAAIPDKPTDVGAPMLTPGGSAGPGTKLKLQAVSAFNGALPFTEAMTNSLSEHELFEPWPLEFEISGQSLAVKICSSCGKASLTLQAYFDSSRNSDPRAPVFWVRIASRCFVPERLFGQQEPVPPRRPIT